MIWAAAGITLLTAALWMLVPDPRRRLRRLEPRLPPGSGRLSVLVRGRSGAPPLRSRVLLAALGGASALLLLPAAAGAVAGVVVATAIVLLGGQLVPRSRSTGAVQADVADTVELLAVCLAAGSSMGHALDVVAQVSGEETAAVLDRVSGPLGMGVVEQQAWLELRSDATWSQVASDVARSARSGTSLVEVLHVHAEEARMIAEERALQRARTAGVRSVVPLMACFLPAFVLVGVLPIIAGLLGGLLSP